jgi:hypothetical protein
LHGCVTNQPGRVSDGTKRQRPFRIGPEDAPYVVREFQSNFAQEDLIQLENYRIYLKLMIDGMPSWPFSARTLRSSELAQLAGLI